MTDICDEVAERVALGEPVGEGGHVAACERCRATIALATQLAAARSDADPGAGFAARMTVGARRQLVRRRRRRVASGLAAMVASAALATIVVMQSSGGGTDAVAPPIASRPTPVAEAPRPAVQTHPDPAHEQLDRDHDPWASHDVDGDVAALVQLADVDRSLSLGVDWGRIEAPLAPYATLDIDTKTAGDKP